MPIRIKSKGGFKKTEYFLKNAKHFDPMPVLERYGELGVELLAANTPIRTGLTAASWYYEIEKSKDGYILHWNNSNVVDHVNIALIIQYGHATQSGYFVEGRDYINPALQVIFDKLAVQVWKEVSN